MMNIEMQSRMDLIQEIQDIEQFLDELSMEYTEFLETPSK